MTDAHSSTATNNGLPLPGLDGSNPVGFLASLGTLQTLTAANPTSDIAMSWDNTSGTWNPVIHGISHCESSVASTIADHLSCPFQPGADADAKREKAQKHFDAAKTELKKARDDLKKRRLRGKDREDAENEKVIPVQEVLNQRRKDWLAMLRQCVPSPEISLGKHLNATCVEFREAARHALDEASRTERETVDLLASFGSDACMQETNQRMESTPFCFTMGSGRQYFLDTVRQLFTVVDAPHLDAALFRQDEPCDEKLSMRWDPIEDRRYALMWKDPTTQDNKAKTNWAVNLLAYRGLQLLPSMPGPHSLKTTGWSDGRVLAWTWPIWGGCASTSLVRSLLSHHQLAAEDINGSALKAIGIVGVYRAIRLQVGKPPLYKLNFTPARRIV